MDNKTQSLPEINSAIKEINDVIDTSWEIRRSNPLKALKLALQARELCNTVNSPLLTALTYRNAGTALYILSQYAEGLDQLLKAKTMLLIINDKKALADVVRNIGNIYHSTNQYDDSLAAYNESMQLCIEINDKQGEAYNLGNIGYVKLLENKFDEAIKYISSTRDILVTIKDDLGLSDALNNLGRVHLGKNEKEQALHSFEESLKIALQINHLRGIAHANISLGNYYLLNEENEKAGFYLKDAQLAATKLGEKSLLINIHKQLAQYYENGSEFKLALQEFKTFEKLSVENDLSNNQRVIESLKYKFNFEQLELEKGILQDKNSELSEANEIIKTKNIELELLSLVASHTDNVILIFDNKLHLEWTNDSFSKYTGAQFATELLKNKSSIYEVSGNTEIKNAVSQCISLKKSVRYNSSFTNQSGEQFWFSSTLSPVFCKEGILQKLVIIDTDITESKHAEEIINSKNKDIRDSINYAERIQKSLLPNNKIFEKLFSDYFIFYKPRDTVSGDFYWISEVQDYILLAVIDCTGHGVPGAMMSMIASAFLNNVVHKKHVNSPSAVLKQLYLQLDFAFTQYNSHTRTNDGMDIALIEINKIDNSVRFSGVNRNLFVMKNDKLIEYKSLRSPSNLSREDLDKLSDVIIDVDKGDMLYLFTDGLIDQFGGSENKKLGSARFKKLLTDVANKSCVSQNIKIEDFYLDWKKQEPQTDDILLLGIKL